jgi:DNA-binding phage protein
MAVVRKRILRRLTAKEAARHRRLVAEVQHNKASIVRRGRAVLAAHDHLQHALQALKAKREERGVSLAELQRLSGIDRARLSRLESDPSANPTIATLDRIAHALGVELRISVIDADASAGVGRR